MPVPMCGDWPRGTMEHHALGSGIGMLRLRHSSLGGIEYRPLLIEGGGNLSDNILKGQTCSPTPQYTPLYPEVLTFSLHSSVQQQPTNL